MFFLFVIYRQVFYHIDKYNGYFTSNRSESSIGMNDLYKFSYPEPVVEEPEEEEPEEEPYVPEFNPDEFNPMPGYFDLDSDEINEVFKKELSKIADSLKSYSDYKIVVTGYSDTKGPQNYSLKLADKRAKNVKNFITDKGIDDRQIREDRALMLCVLLSHSLLLCLKVH